MLNLQDEIDAGIREGLDLILNFVLGLASKLWG